MKSNAKELGPTDRIIDVVQFFFAITEKYTSFERDILQLIDIIPQCSPQQIVDECDKIREQRNKLAIMDQQMFDIIELAGNEIIQNPMIQDYRVAFAGANMACNNLYQKLQALRTTLQDAQRPTFSVNYR